MKVEIKVPSMGESIAEATVGTILKPSGSKVALDDEILELETDKVNQVLYAPQAGTITWKVSSGEQVKIGQLIGEIEPSDALQKEPTPEPPKKKNGQKDKSTPSKELHISEEALRLPKESFIAAAAKTPSAALAKNPDARESRKKMSHIRRVIATRLVEAQKTTAMLTTFNEVDLSKVIDLRQKYRDPFEKSYGVKLGFLSFFVKAAVAALQAMPEINSYLDGDEIVTRHYYDIGIAVSTERGLIVPVLRNCDLLSFAEMEQAVALYAEKARKGGLSADDLQGGSFTITNGGIFGSLLSTPILNPPQSAILGMHKIEKRPVAEGEQIVIRPMMYLALSYDHRLIDGKEAVTFLVRIKELLEDPARLLLNI